MEVSLRILESETNKAELKYASLAFTRDVVEQNPSIVARKHYSHPGQIGRLVDWQRMRRQVIHLPASYLCKDVYL